LLVFEIVVLTKHQVNTLNGLDKGVALIGATHHKIQPLAACNENAFFAVLFTQRQGLLDTHWN
jgi:hypothetical protein